MLVYFVSIFKLRTSNFQKKEKKDIFKKARINWNIERGFGFGIMKEGKNCILKE